MMAKQFISTILTLTVKTYRLYPCSLLISHNVKTRFETLYLCTTQTIRKYCSDQISNNDERDSKKLNKKHKNFHNNRNALLVDTISSRLSINKNDALQIYNTFRASKQLSKDEIIDTIEILKEAGILPNMIRDNISLFIRNINHLKEKIYCIRHLKDNMNDVLPLLDINVKYLQALIIDEVHRENKTGKNKIRYLADMLQCSVYRICEQIVDEPSIMTLSFTRIKTVINLLKDYNYDSEDIINNLWLFKYSPRTIRRRSSTAKSAGVMRIKTWIIRCSENLLQRYTSSLKKEAHLNNVYGSHIQLLSAKFNMSEEEVEFYIKRFPAILEVQLDKVNEVLDILINYGYNVEDILFCQRIFLLKISVLKERLERLHAIRGSHRLSLVYCSTKAFEKTVQFADKTYNKRTN